MRSLVLGYPGGLGGGLVDYLTSDGAVAPPGAAWQYAERLVLLPCFFLAADHGRVGTAEAEARSGGGGGGGGDRDGDRGGGERYERSSTFNPRGLGASREGGDAGGPPAPAPSGERRKLNLAPRGSTKPADAPGGGSSLADKMAALGQ